MKFNIEKNELLKVLQVIQRGISTSAQVSTQQAYYQGIYLEAKENTIIFQSTNSKTSIKYVINAVVDIEGAIVVPGKLFINIIKNMPSGVIFVTNEGTEVIISCNMSSFSLHGLDIKGFPTFPSVIEDKKVEIPYDIFLSLAEKTYKFVTKEVKRLGYAMTGVLLSIEDNMIRFTAIDTVKIAIAEYKLKEDIDDFSVIIPADFIADIINLPKIEENLSLSINENQIIVTYGDITFINVRIEGNFINYKSLINNNAKMTCVINRSSLQQALRRASIFNSSNAKVSLTFKPEKNIIQLKTTEENGSTEELIECNCEGIELSICFNVANIFGGLSVMDTEDVIIELEDKNKTGIMKSEGESKFTYIMMPVRE